MQLCISEPNISKVRSYCYTQKPTQCGFVQKWCTPKSSGFPIDNGYERGWLVGTIDKPIWSFYSRGRHHVWTCPVGAAEGYQRKPNCSLMLEPKESPPQVLVFTRATGCIPTNMATVSGSKNQLAAIVDSWVCFATSWE